MISGYSSNGFIFGEDKFCGSSIITPEQNVVCVPLMTSISVSDIKNLNCVNIDFLLLGTGCNCTLLSPELINYLHAQTFNFEVIPTQIAYRLYNILISEGRKVLTLLVIDCEN